MYMCTCVNLSRRQLDFLLRVHFSQLPSLLCMLPYDLVPESLAPLVAADPRPYASSSSSQSATAAHAAATAATAALLAQQGAATGGGAGAAASVANEPAVLVMTKAESGPHDSHTLMVLRNLDALSANPNLRPILAKLLAASAPATASAAAGDAGGAGGNTRGFSDDHYRRFQGLGILVNQQLAARLELRVGCHLILQVLLSTSSSSSSSSFVGGESTMEEQDPLASSARASSASAERPWLA